MTATPGQPLPQILACRASDTIQDIWQQAYSHLCLFERQASSSLATAQQKDRNQVQSDLVSIRYLGYLLRELPRPEGVNRISKAINARAQSFEGILEVAQFFSDNLFKIFKGGRTPDPSSHSLHSEPFQTTLSGASGDLGNDETTGKNALERDNYRCLFCGAIDPNAGRAACDSHFQRLQQPAEYTFCVHIIPEALNNLDTNFLDRIEELEIASYLLTDAAEAVAANSHDETKICQISPRISILDVFDSPAIISSELGGRDIHRLENIMTLCTNDRARFDNLEIWLEPVGSTPNLYHVRVSEVAFRPAKYVGRGRTEPLFQVKLPDSSVRGPSSHYLALHAACCRVAHLSGMAEFVDNLLQEFDDVAVPAGYITDASVLTAFTSGLLYKKGITVQQF
ncbi:hypothetical protein VKT23_013259 [Stygiomarasmius scandens]|uniref:HNH nuclease domain-containing protein n=1 Tax=Marasmiellus scandens TaxID=2682957 RepID=A0ABR1J408_9AGAR